ncbi:MAG: galactose-1-phosphate uridylyltransferase [Pseudanabaenaceae cyanobacterium]
MREIRQNLITKDWVIFATERAKRPHEFADPDFHKHQPLPAYRSDCPFCVGNENDGTVETLRLPEPKGKGWQVRVTANKYPALSVIGERIRKNQGLHHSVTAVGYHEVIIEHPLHSQTLALMPVTDVAHVITAYRSRYRSIQQDPRIEAIVIFKNHGVKAGISLEHSHSQLAGLPIVPFQFRMRIDAAIRYFDDYGSCLFCRTIEDELQTGERVVAQNEHFVAFIPYAALSPFHLWIFPLRHCASFADISDQEISSLAEILKTVLAKLYFALGNPDYNFTIRSSPTSEQDTEYFHWYLAIVPHVTRIAGFELGSGMYINTSMPEDSARFLREQQIPDLGSLIYNQKLLSV